MNSVGVVRNRQTGYVLKWQIHGGNTKQMSLPVAGRKCVCISYPSLMLQLFGERVGKKTPIPVNISNGNRQIYFPNCRQCSLFLAKALSIPQSTIWNWLSRRKSSVAGWRVNYLF